MKKVLAIPNHLNFGTPSSVRTDANFIDLLKAFDRVQQKQLLTKFRNLKLTRKQHNVFKSSSVTDRSQSNLTTLFLENPW